MFNQLTDFHEAWYVMQVQASQYLCKFQFFTIININMETLQSIGQRW
jgi:hypothetical protein